MVQGRNPRPAPRRIHGRRRRLRPRRRIPRAAPNKRRRSGGRRRLPRSRRRWLLRGAGRGRSQVELGAASVPRLRRSPRR